MKHVALACLLTIGLFSNGQSQDIWSWQNPRPTLMNLNAVHFPISNTLTGWAVGHGGTIVKTGNGGVTWGNYTGIDPSINLEGVWFNSLLTGYAVGTGGAIFKTTNSGTAWVAQTSGVAHDLKSIHFLNGTTGWAVGHNGSQGVILNTTNGGTSWSAQTYGGARFTGVKMVDAFVGYATGQIGVIYKTVDGGISWNPLTSGVTQDLRSLHFADADLGWVVGNAGTILQTTDGGFSWIPRTSGTARNLGSVQFADVSKGWAAGDSGQIYKTTDGGVTWAQKNNGGTHLRMIQAVGDTLWAVGVAGRVLRSLDGGTVWSTLSSGVQQILNALHFSSATAGYAVGAAGTLLKSTDLGVTWSSQTSGTANALNAVHFADANTGYAVGVTGTVIKTTDAGQSWAPLSSGTTSALNAVHFTSPLRGYVAGAGAVLRVTTDGGATWNPRTTGATQAFTSIAFANPAIGWAVGGNAIRRTSDSGATWNPQGTALSGIVGIHVLDTNNVLVLRSTGLYRTRDGGATWTTAAGTGTLFRSLRFQTPAKGYVVTGNGAVGTTADSGNTWTFQQVLQTGYSLNAITIAPGGRTFTAGVDGTLLKLKPALPSAFFYNGPYVFGAGFALTPVTPSYSGVVTNFTISPALPAGLTFDTLTGVISGTPSAAQVATSHSASAHNETGSASASVNIAVRNPIATFAYPARQISLAKAVEMTPAVPALTGTVPFGPVTCTVAPNLPSGLALDGTTCAISGTPANAQAFGTYVVTAKNGFAPFNKSDTLRIMVQAPPTNLAYAVPQPTYTVGQAITPNTASLTVVTGTTVRYSVAPPLPAGLTIDTVTGTISGTPTLAAAAVNHTVTATSTAGNTTAVVRITVVGPPTGLSYGSVVFGINVPDSGRGVPVVSGTVTHWSITPALPAGLGLDTITGKFFGTGTEAVSGSAHTITAHNAYGSVSTSVSVSVLNPIVLFSYSPKVFNLDPKVTMPPVSPIVAGTLPFTPVTYSVSPALPAGLQLNPNTGALSGTPDSGTSQLKKKYAVTARNGVTAFNVTDTLSIAISGTVGILGANGDPALRLQIAGRGVSFRAPEETRGLRLTIRDLRGRVLLERAVAWPPQAAIILARDGAAGSAGLLLVRVEYRDGDGRPLGSAQRRVPAIP